VSGELVADAGVDRTLALARRLQVLSEKLAETRAPQDVLDAVLDTGLEAAGAARGLIAVLDATAERIEIAASRGYAKRTMDEWHSFPLRDDLPLSRAVLRLEPVFLRSQQERDELFPALRGRSEDGHALTCLPLVVEGRAIGGLVLSFARDEVFDEERRRFKAAMANQVAQALERTRLFDAEQKLRRRMSFLAQAGYLLASSLDYRETLTRVAQLAVPDLADWCAVDMLSGDGTRIERLAVAHVDPEMVAWASELGERYMPPLDAPYGVAKVIRTQEPELIPVIDDDLLVAASEGDRELLELLRRLDLRSAITVPLAIRDRPLGALTLIRTGTAAAYLADDLELALDLARRAAMAVDNALLFRETQEQADAARALAHVADAVVMLDPGGVVRYWNAAAERMTGLRAAEVIGRPAGEVPGWPELTASVPTTEEARATIVPLPTPASERWLSVRAVGFDNGVVYALRDVTGERELERLRSEFVATASHELRTPLAAVYGAIRSLRRTDVEMSDENRQAFLTMIETEAERLRTLVNQLLIAGRLDAGAVELSALPVALSPLVEEVVNAARVTAPESISFEPAIDGVSPVQADHGALRQVLTCLVDNAVKYSPEGGAVEISAREKGDRISISIADHGLGIPLAIHGRIFEKFFRADPNLRGGVGGTGLGLYVAAELTERMGGRISVSSSEGWGSTFTIDLPIASGA
jgi:PAS domain S-box-containing protein